MNPIRRVAVAGLAGPLFVTAAPAGATRGDQPSPLVEQESPTDFVTTEGRLMTAVEAGGMTLFARIDHAAAARQVGLSIPPTVVLVFGNPKGGTPAMVAAPRAALELPLRVLVREDGRGRTFICYQPVGEPLASLGVPRVLAQRLQGAQEAVVSAALS